MKRLLRLSTALVLGVMLSGCGQRAQQQPRHPEWSYNAVMYELNTRQFTGEGTFAAAAGHLPRLQELGVNIIWLMPIQPIGVEERKGELGSYYSISDYRAVNPEFGTMDDFKRFVAEAHDMGFRVIIDWVANHTSRDAKWLVNSDWYMLDPDGFPIAPYDWTDVAKLNYDNEQMRTEMVSSMRYWLEETGINGFRCDVAGDVPTDFWKTAITELREFDSDIFMLAEAEKPELHTIAGFDASYAWELHHIMNQIAQGKYHVDALRDYFGREHLKHPESAIRLTFTSNHDENSWNGTEFERMGDAAKTFAVLSYVVPGMPLIYNGQEVGFDRRLEFFRKDSIDWNDRGGFTPFYTTLNNFKHHNAAVAAGERGGRLVELVNDHPEQVFSFVREAGGNRVIAVFNFSPEATDVRIRLGKLAGSYTKLFGGETVQLDKNAVYTLSPWEYAVYVQ